MQTRIKEETGEAEEEEEAAAAGRRMHFALNKATDFSNSLGIHIWRIRVWQGHYVPIQKNKNKKKKTRTEERDREETKKRKRKKREKKTSVLLFVFSLVYLVWGSLVYNIYHHVFQNYLLRNWLYWKKKMNT